MTTYIGLLRGVNVGGNKKLPMADLRALMEALGLKHPRTLLQSGNIVFESPHKPAALEALLAEQTEKRLGLTTRYLLRTAQEWDAIVAGNPFVEEAAREPARFIMFLLADKRSAAALKALERVIPGDERMHGAGTHIYATFPSGIADTKFTTNFIDAKLGTTCTGRNWNTVLKLAALAKGTA